jgi:predicted amidohydrolase YtcJ
VPSILSPGSDEEKNHLDVSPNSAEVFRSGKFLTMDSKNPRASVVACLNGYITYVGDDFKEALATLPQEAAVVDLKGRNVIPGLIDSHAHILHEGLKLSQLDLRGQGHDDVLEAVFEETKVRPKGEWIHGRGWDQTLWEGHKWPTRQELDKVSPDHPVVLDRTDNHSIWVNTLALEKANVNKNTKTPQAGEIGRQSDGSPSGVLIGKAIFLVYQAMPVYDGHQFDVLFQRSLKEMNGFGLTTVVDCATRAHQYPQIEEAVAKGAVKTRLKLYMTAEPWDDEFLSVGPRRNLYGGRLSVDGLKLFSDGSLGSRSAWLEQDYADQPGHRGGHSYSDEALEEVLIKARDLGFQVAIHVIGDAAIAQAVKIMAKVLGVEKTNRNWRLEHYQLAGEKDREMVSGMGLIPSIQSVGIMTDLRMLEDRLGPERSLRSYAWREIIDWGGYVINGSDCPVESPNPFLGIYAAITRQNLNWRPNGGFTVQNCLSRLEAIASYTIWPAMAAFEEKRLGTITVGKFCDFAVLDRDILTCPERAIAATRVVVTVIGGELLRSSPD